MAFEFKKISMTKNNNPKTLKLAQIILSRVGVCDYWKLLKLMYFIDFQSYYLRKKPITENVYYHLPYGPVPDGYKTNIINQGIEKGLWEHTGVHSLMLKNTGCLEGLTLEKEDEIYIEHVLEKYGSFTGKELVALSHDDPPWYLTDDNEKIDYELVAWRDSKVSDSEDITDKVKNA